MGSATLRRKAASNPFNSCSALASTIGSGAANIRQQIAVSNIHCGTSIGGTFAL
jgi:hypothetical protein